MRRYLTDTLAMIVFTTAFGMFAEIFILNMTFAQSLFARVSAIPINFIIARPYGMFRDWLFLKTSAQNAGQMKKAAADTAAYALFQVPPYLAILFGAGANTKQLFFACCLSIAVSALAGRPYGIFLDFARKISKRKTE